MFDKHRLEPLWEKINQIDWEFIGYLIIASLLALAVRVSLLSFKSVDFETYTKVWYNALQSSGYLALKDDFSNYNPPYLYLLYLVVRFLPGLDKVAAIKIPSLICDFICAGFIYKIVRLKYEKRLVALLAYIGTLLSPTVILNSSFWGQADSIYTAGILACIYFLMTKRNWFSLFSFGIAFAFKLQAIFLLPLLISMWIRKELSWKYFLAVPVIYFFSILPAWLIGRPILNLISIYFSQAGEYNKLSSHAPTLYAWFPLGRDIFQLILPAGIAFAITVILVFILVIVKSRVKLSDNLLLELALLSVLVVPFVLPKMHQRYFFPADILSIAFGFYFPTYFFIPLVITVVSFFSYQYFLFGVEPFSTSNLALVTFAMLAIIISKVIRDLYYTNNEGSEFDDQQLTDKISP
jgi:Gpi18-like mannosyltransferase